MTESKLSIRNYFKAVRKKIPSGYREKAKLEATKVFVDSVIFEQNQHFACYIATSDEFDTSGIIEAIWQAKKTCYVPALDEKKENTLLFVKYEYGDVLQLNRHRVLEPINISQQIEPEQLEVVVLPLLAFDSAGHRLGTGGGYFDRTFHFLHENYTPKPFMLGLGFEAQKADELPTDVWDINLDGILTEKNLFRPL